MTLNPEKLVEVDYCINGSKSKSSKYRNKNKTEIKLRPWLG